MYNHKKPFQSSKHILKIFLQQHNAMQSLTLLSTLERKENIKKDKEMGKDSVEIPATTLSFQKISGCSERSKKPALGMPEYVKLNSTKSFRVDYTQHVFVGSIIMENRS